MVEDLKRIVEDWNIRLSNLVGLWIKVREQNNTITEKLSKADGLQQQLLRVEDNIHTTKLQMGDKNSSMVTMIENTQAGQRETATKI